MGNIKTKIHRFIDSNWFSVILSIITVFSYILNLPYLGFYSVVTSLLFIVIFKNDFKATLPIIFLLFGNHQTFIRNFSDPWMIILLIYFGIVIILFLYNVILDFNNYFSRLNKDLVFYSMIAITVSMLLSLINTPVIGESMIGLTLWLTILFSYVLVRSTVDDTEDNKNKIVFSILLCGLVLCIMVIYKVSHLLLSGYSIKDVLMKNELHLGWANINHVAAFINICIILANYYFLKNKEITKKIFAILSITFYCFISAISLCRGGYFTLVLMIPLLIIVNIIYLFKSTNTLKIKMLYLSGFIASIGVVLLSLQLTGVLPTLISKVSGKGFDPSGRNEVYMIALERFLKHPIIGQGVYSSRYYLESLNWHIFNYHNHFLQMLGTCGILGALAFTCFLLFSIKRILKKDSFSLFTLLVMFYFLIHGALDTLFFNAYVMPILCLLLAVNTDSRIKDEFPSLFKKKNEECKDEQIDSTFEAV